MSNLKSIGGLWKRVSQKNETFLYGSITMDIHLKKGQKIMVFLNSYRNSEKQFEYKLMASTEIYERGKQKDKPKEETSENVDFQNGEKKEE